MALSREEFAAAFRALSTKTRTAHEVRGAFREQVAQAERGRARSLGEILNIPPGPPIDLRSDPEALDTLGEILLQLEILTEAELDRFIQSSLSRTARKTLPPVDLPAELNRFEVQWEIGRGRSGAVFRGSRTEEPRQIAIKVYRTDAKPDPERLKALVERNEPGLVRALEAGDGTLVMEFVEGSSLDDLLADRKVSLRRGFELVEKAAGALAPLHARGQAHGSLSAGSLLIGRDDSVRIADFGLSPGTPADDVFALGQVLYEIAAGVPAFAGFRARELRSPSRFNGAASGAAEQIVLRTLSRDPSRRYPHAGALAEDLGRYLRHEELAEAPEFGKAAGARRIHWGWPAGVATGIVLLVLAVLAFTGGRKESPAEAPRAESPSNSAPAVTADGAERRPDPPSVSNPPRAEVAPPRREPIGRREELDLRYAATQALAAGDSDRLIELGQEFVDRGPDRDFAFYWLAIGHRGMGRPDKALEAIDQAIQRNSANTDYLQVRLPLLLERAENRRALGDIDRLYGKNVSELNAAIKQLTSEIGAGGAPPLSWIHRGALLHHKRNYRQAADDFRMAVRLGDSRAHYFLGLSLLEDDHPDEAAQSLRQFLEGATGPAAAEAREVLARLEQNGGSDENR